MTKKELLESKAFQNAPMDAEICFPNMVEYDYIIRGTFYDEIVNEIHFDYR